jgi:alpha-beta hydrolase superfamily lysophospholipase
VAVALGGFALVALVILLGPRARFEGEWVEPSLGSDIDAHLAAEESRIPDLKPGEAKTVVWADSGAVTPVSIVYLHGFSADRHEVEPLVSDLARELGANAYFARLSGHGRGGAALGEATVAEWLADAAEAVAIGARIGERVVLMGTSTGGTLALWAAAQEEAADRVAALVLISPNLGLRDPTGRFLTWPWGGAIARAVVGPERCFEPETPEQALHWTVCYPTRALLPMMALVQHVRSMDLERVRVPTLVVYSEADQVVDTEETARLLSALRGSRASAYLVERSGDPAAHVIAGSIMSPGTTDEVRVSIVEFLGRVGVVHTP